MLARTIGGAVGAAGLVLAGVAPATAHGDHHHHHGHDEVKVLVCVKFDDHHHHGGDSGDSSSQRSTQDGDHEHGDHEHGDVNVKVRTDEERSFEIIGDGECARFDLRFDDNWVKVKAWPPDPEDEVHFKTFGRDVEDATTHDNTLRAEFDSHEHDPFVGVGILVDEHHHEHH
jgi:hypothetical protein